MRVEKFEGHLRVESAVEPLLEHSDSDHGKCKLTRRETSAAIRPISFDDPPNVTTAFVLSHPRTLEINSLSHAVELAVAKFGYSLWMNDAREMAVFDIMTHPKSRWRTQCFMYERERFVEFNIFCTDDGYSEDRKAWVRDLSMAACDRIPHGCFIYRDTQADVRYRVVRSFGPEVVTVESLVHVLECTAFPLALWSLAFSHVHFSSFSPLEAFEAALYVCDASDGQKSPKAKLSKLLTVSTNEFPESAPPIDAAKNLTPLALMK